MNKAFILIFFVLLSSELIESKPRYGYRFWRKFVHIESSEEDSSESCVDCTHTNIGNGYKNRNVISKSSHPNNRENQGQTEIYQEIGEQNENVGQTNQRVATKQRGNDYRTTSKPAYSFDNNELQEAGGNNYNQRPFRSNGNQVHNNRRPYYNDYETNYRKKPTSEIGDFGNGHDNSNTFNIHKKVIYIS